MRENIELWLALGIYLYSIYLLNSDGLSSIKNGILLCASVVIGVHLSKLGSAFMLPYFCVQCISDKKEKKVYSALNYVVILCAVLYNGLTWWNILMCLALLLLSSRYGSGDVKCMIAMCILLRQPLFGDSVFCMLFYMFISELVFIITRFVKKVPKKERTAFFPAMLFGYCAMLVLL